MIASRATPFGQKGRVFRAAGIDRLVDQEPTGIEGCNDREGHDRRTADGECHRKPGHDPREEGQENDDQTDLDPIQSE